MADHDVVITRIREQMQAAKAAYWDRTVLFLAEKLVVLTDGHWEAVLEQATALFRMREFRRALHTLKLHKLLNRNVECRVIAARCLMELDQFQECSVMLETPLDEPLQSERGKSAASIALVRAQLSDSLEHKENAAFWYQECVRADVHNYEALDRLVEGRFLSPADAAKFLATLRFDAEDEWLRVMYTAKLGKSQEDASVGVLYNTLADQHGLADSVDVLADQASLQQLMGHTDKAFALTKRVRAIDAYHTGNLLTHICCLVRLRLKNELFYLAHTLTKETPESPISWFAVGCYYQMTGTRDLSRARAFYHKATATDPQFAAGWLALGNCCSDEEESDQAIVAYRTAARLFPASLIPWLSMGKEAIRSRNLPLAEQYISYACQLAPHNPAAIHEAGVILYENGKYARAVDVLNRALKLWSSSAAHVSEATLFNLGHAYRKLKQYPKAINCYERALALNTRSATAYCAIGFTRHLMREFDVAIEMYHKALSLHPSDSFCAVLLDQALNDWTNYRTKA